MSDKPDGGPAFPRVERAETYEGRDCPYVTNFETVGGMSLRDHFAACALQSFPKEWFKGMPNHPEFSDFAKAAYLYADAMIAERAK